MLTMNRVVISAHEQKLGLHGSPTCPIFFDKVEVAADALIGEVGQGAQIAFHALNRGRIALAATALGITRASLIASATYANSRKQFGQAVIDFEGVSFKLADMRIAVAASEGILDDAIEAFVTDARDVKERVAAGKGLLHRSSSSGGNRCGADPWRLWILQGIPGRALLPRCEGVHYHRRYEPDPAQDHC